MQDISILMELLSMIGFRRLRLITASRFATLQLLDYCLSRCITHTISHCYYSFILSPCRILCRRPFYIQKWCYISELLANRYILSFDLDESCRLECQQFLRGCSFFWMRRVQHTHVRVGFSDYKLLIYADNPFLLYYTNNDCLIGIKILMYAICL